MWSYGSLVTEVCALYEEIGMNNQLECIAATVTPYEIPTTLNAHLQGLARKNNPITWQSSVLLDVQNQRNQKFKVKRHFIEIRGQVLWTGKRSTNMQILLHTDDLTAVEPSCLAPCSLILITASAYILITFPNEVEYSRWKALLRHHRPLGHDNSLQVKAQDDVYMTETVLQSNWSIAECMKHLKVDADKYCIHVNGTNQFWTNMSSSIEDYVSMGDSLKLTAIPTNLESVAAVKSGGKRSTLNIRLHKICSVFEYFLELRGCRRILAERQQTQCIIRMEMVEGAQVHCVVDTAPFTLMCDSSRYLENVWYSLWNTPDDIPASWRLLCTIYAVDIQPEDDGPGDEKDWVKLASTGIQVRNIAGELVSGQYQLQLLDTTAELQRGPLPLGVAHGAPFMHIECQWSEFVNFRRLSHATSHDTSIMKQGRLYELNGTLWSNWQPRWCVVTSHGQVILEGDDKNPVIISMENIVVNISEKHNSTYRRSSSIGSKSTQKEYTTYAFTIEVDQSTTYVLGAPTKHARDDWLHTLRVAMPTSSRKSIDLNWSFRGTSLSDEPENQQDDVLSSLPWLLERIERDPLFKLSSFQRALLWQNRHILPKHFIYLPRLLSCRDWNNPANQEELQTVLLSWERPANIVEYVILLDRVFSHLHIVRKFAIDQLDALDDPSLADLLPQLVQCIKWEPFISSRLVTWLVNRAVENPAVIGTPFFWALQVETYVPHCTQRFQLVLQAYLMAAGRFKRKCLQNQLELCRELHRLARDMQTIPAQSTLTSQLRQRLSALNVQFAGRVSLPLHGNHTLLEFIPSECRVLKSPKRPLWLTFKTTLHEKVAVIFKAGDDVRQDMLSLQLFGLMERLWKDADLNIPMQRYGCVATTPSSGLVEVVTDAVTTAAIHKEGGVLGPMQEERFAKWLESQNPHPKQHMQAIDLFRRSCAGYCVATHVLGIGDRHNDNIMITNQGMYFHIDFGHFLGHCKYHMNFKRDQTPFVFTKEMAFALGGVECPLYQKFVSLCGQAFNVLRQQLHLICTWLVVMIPAEMSELNEVHDIYHVVEALDMDMTPDEAASKFGTKIQTCLDHPYKRIDNTIHNLVHFLRP